MSISDIFYTESCILYKSAHTEPDKRGYVKTTYEPVSDDVACSVTPINTAKSREKWGIHSTATCEITFDLNIDVDVKQISAIEYRGELYLVENYEIYPAFMILSESVVFAVRLDTNG